MGLMSRGEMWSDLDFNRIAAAAARRPEDRKENCLESSWPGCGAQMFGQPSV